MKYFNIKIEFDHNFLHKKINETITKNRKGYISVVDANVLTIAQKDNSYRKIINNSLINTCDGGSIATICGLIHREKFCALSGPEIFKQYIGKPYSHLLLGSTSKIVDRIKDKMLSNDLPIDNIHHLALPFEKVDKFDYESISREINRLKPDIIWVSLGAPKQDIFMHNIIPLVERGLFIGIGAALSFYAGEIKLSNYKIGAFRFFWLSRLLHEPVKIGKRILPYVRLLPKLWWQEYKKVNRK